MAYTYKAKNGLNFFVPGVGRSVNGILESETLLECPALELVEASQIAQPGAIIGVAPQATIISQPATEPIEAVAPTSTNNPQES